MAKAVQRDSSDANLDVTWDALYNTRPTAYNLRWALDRMREHLRVMPAVSARRRRVHWAIEIADEDVRSIAKIGVHGLDLIRTLVREKGGANRSISYSLQRGLAGNG